MVPARRSGTDSRGPWCRRAGGGSVSNERTAKPQARVIEVIDGDTLVVELPDGSTDTVRILGVDTPETHHPTKGVEFRSEAAAHTQAFTGRDVRLVGDVEPRDIYGRRLAYVIVDGHRFDDELLRKGYARLLVIDPNRAHARDLLAAELTARRAKGGSLVGLRVNRTTLLANVVLTLWSLVTGPRSGLDQSGVGERSECGHAGLPCNWEFGRASIPHSSHHDCCPGCCVHAHGGAAPWVNTSGLPLPDRAEQIGDISRDAPPWGVTVARYVMPDGDLTGRVATFYSRRLPPQADFKS